MKSWSVLVAGIEGSKQAQRVELIIGDWEKTIKVYSFCGRKKRIGMI